MSRLIKLLNVKHQKDVTRHFCSLNATGNLTSPQNDTYFKNHFETTAVKKICFIQEPPTLCE